MRPGKTCSPTAVGVLLALALYALFDRRSAFRRRDARGSRCSSWLGCVVIYVAPIVSMARAYLHRDGQFPVLANFDSRVELVLDRRLRHQTRRPSTACSTWNSHRDKFPGVLIPRTGAGLAPFQDPGRSTWKILTAVPLKLGMRVHDIGHGREYIDRFNRNFELAPQERRDIADSARGDSPWPAEPPDEYGRNLGCNTVSDARFSVSAPAPAWHAAGMMRCR